MFRGHAGLLHYYYRTEAQEDEEGGSAAEGHEALLDDASVRMQVGYRTREGYNGCTFAYGRRDLAW
jgi:hypothetical protein